MKYYYGLVDKDNNGYGFVLDGDSRITSDFIELTEEEWQALLTGQSNGSAIVSYNGKVFNDSTGRYYVDDNGVWQKYTAKEAAAQKAEIEAERVNNLTMTALDFIGVLQSAGLTLEQINAYLEANLEVKMQLTYCQNVYCGVVKQLMPITVGDITITAEDIETAFKAKNSN